MEKPPSLANMCRCGCHWARSPAVAMETTISGCTSSRRWLATYAPRASEAHRPRWRRNSRRRRKRGRRSRRHSVLFARRGRAPGPQRAVAVAPGLDELPELPVGDRHGVDGERVHVYGELRVLVVPPEGPVPRRPEDGATRGDVHAAAVPGSPGRGPRSPRRGDLRRRVHLVEHVEQGLVVHQLVLEDHGQQGLDGVLVEDVPEPLAHAVPVGELPSSLRARRIRQGPRS